MEEVIKSEPVHSALQMMSWMTKGWVSVQKDVKKENMVTMVPLCAAYSLIEIACFCFSEQLPIKKLPGVLGIHITVWRWLDEQLLRKSK